VLHSPWTWKMEWCKRNRVPPGNDYWWSVAGRQYETTFYAE
jgi:hypothetical protein